MKLSTRLAATTALAFVLAQPVLAHQALAQSAQPAAPAAEAQPQAAQTRDQPAAAPAGAVVAGQTEEQVLASSLIGRSVQDPQGETIGEIADLVLDQDDRVVAAVLSVGGFLGLGSKSVGVPWSKLEVTEADGHAIVIANVTEQQLADAPAFRTQADIRADAARQRVPAQGGAATAQ